MNNYQFNYLVFYTKKVAPCYMKIQSKLVKSKLINLRFISKKLIHVE